MASNPTYGTAIVNVRKGKLVDIDLADSLEAATEQVATMNRKTAGWDLSVRWTVVEIREVLK